VIEVGDIETDGAIFTVAVMVDDVTTLAVVAESVTTT
jgi:hypothetical protein